MTSPQVERPLRGRAPRGRYAMAGLLSALGAMSAGHAVAGLVEPMASPVLAVGTVVVDATPTAVKTWAVEAFGTVLDVVDGHSIVLVESVPPVVTGIVEERIWIEKVRPPAMQDVEIDEAGEGESLADV